MCHVIDRKACNNWPLVYLSFRTALSSGGPDTGRTKREYQIEIHLGQSDTLTLPELDTALSNVQTLLTAG